MIIIFDMDATLIDSNYAITKTINDKRAKLNFDRLNENFILNLINNPTKNAFKELFPNIEISKTQMQEFEKDFNQNYKNHAKIYPQAFEILTWALENKHKLAVASNAPIDTINKVLEGLKIKDKFDFIVGVSDEIEPKPNPKMLNLIINNSKENAIFIGDSMKDFLAAKNANLPYINVLWGRFDEINGAKNCKFSKEVICEIEKLIF